MIRFSNISLIRGRKVLLEGADAVLNPGDRIGLIGANGSGKSSLFAVLRGELHTDKGDAEFPPQWRVAHVAQETPALERSAVDYAIDGDTNLRRLEEELSRAEQADDGHLIGELHAALGDAGSYTVRARAEQLLIGLGFKNSELESPVTSFSGGWRMRLNLAQALMCPSDLLLLDEPTNHLDLDAILWVEDWLKRYRGTLLVVSHDRDFLDGVVNVILHIDQKKLRRYAGNYSEFEVQRAQAVVLAAGQREKQERERAHLQSFIDRFKAKASKARQAQSRMKMLAKMEDLAPLHVAAPFSFEFREPLRAPNPLLVLEDADAGYAEKTVLRGINFSLQSEQRYGLLGINGAGKSTLIKTIAGELKPLRGTALFNKGLVIGYFAQHQVEMLRDDQSPLWHLQKASPASREQDLRSFLGGFNFPGEMALGPIASFSGGEKARLALALIVWQRPNLLLLDEPTNHLDLETREALTVALAQFEGTLVLVSHDRHLLRATTDQFLIVADGQLRPFDGDLDDYRDWLLKSKREEAAAPAVPSMAGAMAAPKAAARPSNERRILEARIRRLEEMIARLNAKKAELEARLADPAGAFERIRRSYDEVLVYGHQHVFDVAAEYALPADIAARIRYVGAVIPSRTPATSKPRRAAVPHLLFTIGGGEDGCRTLLDAAATLRGPLARQNLRATFVAGPLAPADECSALARVLHDDRRCTLVRSARGLDEHLSAADLVVGMGGYNTVYETLAAGTPILTIPRRGPRQEQSERCRRLAELGLLRTLPQEQARDPRAFGAAIASALTARTLPHRLSFDGATRAADLCLSGAATTRSAIAIVP